MILHPKIQALRNSVGTTPILYSNRFTKLEVPLETRRQKSDYEKRVLRQYFAIWGVPDDYGTVPMKGSWTKSIRERGPKSDSKYKITALYMHNQRDSVGLPTLIEEDEIGLYAEIPILEGIQVCDELIIRHKASVCNNGSAGFNYVWDKMEYDESTDLIHMKEVEGFELSFVTIGAQQETYGVRGADGILRDETLIDETEQLIRNIPRKHHLELRSIIDRHISLAKSQPLEQRQKALDKPKPTKSGIDYDYLTKYFS